MLHRDLTKAQDKRGELALFHVRHELVVLLSLAEERMGALLRGIDLDPAVHAEALPGGAEQREQALRQRAQKQEAISPAAVANVRGRESQAEAGVLRIPKSGSPKALVGARMGTCARAPA